MRRGSLIVPRTTPELGSSVLRLPVAKRGENVSRGVSFQSS